MALFDVGWLCLSFLDNKLTVFKLCECKVMGFIFGWLLQLGWLCMGFGCGFVHFFAAFSEEMELAPSVRKRGGRIAGSIERSLFFVFLASAIG